MAWSSMTSRSSDRVSIDSEGHSILSRALARSSAIISGSCSSSSRPVLCSCGQRSGGQVGCGPHPGWVSWGWGQEIAALSQEGAGPGLCAPGVWVGGEEGRNSQLRKLTHNNQSVGRNKRDQNNAPCPGLKRALSRNTPLLSFTQELPLFQEAFPDYHPPPQ